MIKFIKKILSHLFPPSRYVFRLVIGDLTRKIESMLVQQSQMIESMLAHQFQTTQSMLVQQSQIAESILAQQSQMIESMLAQQSQTTESMLVQQSQTTESMLAQQSQTTESMLAQQSQTTESMLAQQSQNLQDHFVNLRDKQLQLLDSLSAVSSKMFVQNDYQINCLKSMSDQQSGHTDILDNLSTRQNNQILYLKGISERQKKAVSEMERTKKLFVAEFDKQNKSLASFSQHKKILWNDEFERRLVTMNWGNITDSSDFEEKFLKLTSGMDAESVLKITRILNRQKKFLNSDEKNLDIYTRAEQEELRMLKENFYSDIFRVSDQLYAYKNYLLPIQRFEASVFYFKHGIDELKTVKNVKGKAIIDVGGFIGDSALVLAELEPSAIYSFEAEPENFNLLKKTLEINNCRNVVAENVALSNSKGELPIHVAGSCSTVIDRPGINYTDDVIVPMITLDEYVAEHNIDVGLIKVDIEGGEPQFIEGARHTICTQKPILLLSIYHNSHDFFELKPIIESWDLGYKFRIHKPTIGNTTSETLLLAEIY